MRSMRSASLRLKQEQKASSCTLPCARHLLLITPRGEHFRYKHKLCGYAALTRRMRAAVAAPHR